MLANMPAVERELNKPAPPKNLPEEIFWLNKRFAQEIAANNLVVLLSVNGKACEQGELHQMENCHEFRVGELVFHGDHIVSITVSSNASFIPVNVERARWTDDERP